MVRLTDKDEYSDVADGDILMAVDISDLSSNPAGTSKGITATNLRAYMSALSLPLSGGTLTGSLAFNNPLAGADPVLSAVSSATEQQLLLSGGLVFDNTMGSNPILFSNSDDQTLSLDGNLAMGSNNIEFAGNTARINKVGSTLDIFCATGVKLIADGETSNTITIFSGRTTNGIANFTDVIARNDAAEDTRFFRRLTNVVDRSDGIEKGDTVFEVIATGLATETLLLNGTTGNVVILTKLQFQNPSGADPILSSDSSNKTLTLDGRLEFDNIGTGSDPVFFSNSTTRTLTAQMEEFEFFENTSTIGSINEIRMAALNSAAELTFYAQIDTNIADPTDGTEDGTIDFSTIVNGASTKILGLNMNMEKEVFIYDNIRFNNTLNSLSGTNISDGGTLYENTGESVTVTGVTSGANNAVATITVLLGVIQTIVFTDRGSGYDNDESLTILGLTSGASNAVVTAITTGFDPVLFANSASKRLELTGDLDINTGNIHNTHVLEFTKTGVDLGITGITLSAVEDGLVLNLPTIADALEININNSLEYEFNHIEFNMGFNKIMDVLLIESTFAVTASVGFIQAGNGINQGYGFRNAANTTNSVLFFNPADAFELNINTAAEYTFSATVADFNNNQIINMELSTGITASSSISYNLGVKQTFNPNDTNAGLNVGIISGTPSAQVNGDIWIDSTSNKIFARINDTDVDLGIGGGSGITSINGDTTPAQIIAVGTGLGLVDAGATHTISIDSSVVQSTTVTAYTAGATQTFLGIVGGTSGLNVGSIAGDPTSKLNGDIWYNSTSNILFAFIGGADTNIGIGGGSGITTLNLDTAATQTLTGGTGITITDSTPDHSFAIDSAVVVTLTGTQTLTNKTFVSPILGTPTSGDATNLTNIPMGNASGTLGVANGGTGVVSFPAGGILYGNGATNILITAAPSSGQIIVGNTTVPAFVTMSGDATIDNTGAVTVSIASTDLSDSANIARNSNNLSFFSATTSAQLATLISDETGSGLLVFGTSPTIVTPTIASFTNATHDHTNAAGGGTLLSTSALSDTADIAYLNTANTYTAGVRQSFLGLIAGTAGINIGGIAGNPSSFTDGDIWLNTSTNQILGRINGLNVNLSFTDGAGFLPLSGGTMTGNISMGANDIEFGSGEGIIQYNSSLFIFNSNVNYEFASASNQPVYTFMADGTTSVSDVIAKTNIRAKDDGGAFKIYSSTFTTILDNGAGTEDASITHTVIRGGSADTPILGLNINSQAEVFVYDRIRFNNIGTGADPEFRSDSSVQDLTLTGTLVMNGIIEMLNNELRFAGNTANINKQGTTLDLFCATGCKFISPSTENEITIFSGLAATGDINVVDVVARNDAVQDVIYFRRRTNVSDRADGTENGTTTFSVMVDGTLTEVLELNGITGHTLIETSLEFNNPSGVNPELVSDSGFKLLEVTGDFQIDGSIFDLNENAIIQLNPIADSVNNITISNSAMNDNPIIGVVGVNSNLGIDFTTKNLGAIRMISCRFQITTGADVTTNVGSQLILGGDGNIFTTTTGQSIQEIAIGSWQLGSTITIVIGGGSTSINPAIGATGGFADILLTGGNFVNQGNGKNITLALIDLAGTTTWVEIARGS